MVLIPAMYHMPLASTPRYLLWPLAILASEVDEIKSSILGHQLSLIIAVHVPSNQSLVTTNQSLIRKLLSIVYSINA